MELSGRFLQIIAKRLDGIPLGGTLGIWILRAEKLYGICLNELFVDDTTLNSEEYANGIIPIYAYLDASKRRIKYYQRLYSIENCINSLKYSPIQFGFDCFESIYKPLNGYVPLPEIGEKNVGAHSVCVLNYSKEKNCFGFINSWGKEWGDNGLGYLPVGYFDEELINEAWSALFPFNKLNKEKILHINDKKGKIYTVKNNKYISPRGDNTISYTYDIYTSSNIIIGFLHANLFNETTLEIEDFFILPQYQNNGLGKKLLEIVEITARKSKLKKVIGWIGNYDLVSSREEFVINFFKKCKFSLIKDGSRFKGAYYRIEKNIKHK